MKDQSVTLAVRRFCSSLDLSAARELEKAIRKALNDGRLDEDEIFTVGVTLSSEKIGLHVTIYNRVELK